VPKLAAFMNIVEHDALACMSFPKEHRAKLHSTNSIKRLHTEIKCRTNVVGIFPNEDTITLLVGAVLLEQNDEWVVSRRYRNRWDCPLKEGVLCLEPRSHPSLRVRVVRELRNEYPMWGKAKLAVVLPRSTPEDPDRVS